MAQISLPCAEPQLHCETTGFLSAVLRYVGCSIKQFAPRLPHFHFLGGSTVLQKQSPFLATESLVSLSIPSESLRPLVESILGFTGNIPGWPLGRVALQENEAAECIGVKSHVLRDARLRLKLPHTQIGRTISYTAEQLSITVNQMAVNS